MRRNKYWQLDLAGFIESRISTPLVWGKSDCCLFAFDAIKSFTGVDAAEEFRGRYATRKGAFESMKLFTAGGSVYETMGKLAKRFKMRMYGAVYFSPISAPRSYIKPGDLVIHRAEACDPVAWRMSAGMTVGVGVDNGAIVCQGKDGLMLNIDPDIVEVWRP